MCDDKMGSVSKEGGSCCGGHGLGWGRKSWLCWLMGAVVLVIVFCTGYKLGMLKAYMGNWGHMRGNYPYHMMMYRGDLYGGGYRGGMMGNWQYRTEVFDGQATTTVPLQ